MPALMSALPVAGSIGAETGWRLLTPAAVSSARGFAGSPALVNWRSQFVNDGKGPNGLWLTT